MIRIVDSTGDARELRIAAALDPRDAPAVAEVVSLLSLEAGSWRDAIEEFAPDVVIVQSLEVRHSEPAPSALQGQARAVARWASNEGIPSIFWSTVGADRALDDVWTAAGFDHVATADLDSVVLWRAALGHDLVHLARLGVGEASLTTRTSPLASFATAFDAAAPPSKLLDLLQAAVESVPVLIHDLAPGDGTGVPEMLRPMLATRPADVAGLDGAARVGLHAPTATTSPTLLDRRLLQLASAGVPVVGTHSHAASLAFGAHATVTDDPVQLAAAVRRVLEAPDVEAASAARDFVRRHHSWPAVLPTLLAPAVALETTAADDVDDSPDAAVQRVAALAQAMEVPKPPSTELRDLAAWFTAIDDADVEVASSHGNLTVTSAAEHPKDTWATTSVAPAELVRPGWTSIWFETDERGLVDLRLRFLTDHGETLATATAHAHVVNAVEVPVGTVTVQAGLRVNGPGRAQLMGLRVGGEPTVGPLVARGEHLLLTNRYPSYDAPYNNMFVHKRVEGYAERGVRTDVLRLVEGAPRSIHEFEGIECVTGGRSVLASLVESGDHDSLAVHFLTPSVWDAVEPYATDLPLRIWIHGFEVQPWWRRAFSYQSDEELEHAKEATGERMEMWAKVFEDPRPHFVFVSQYLADQAMEDTGVTLPPERYSVIHNPVDTNHFAYHEKTPEQRFKLLSIRPFASSVYANDLTVAAILELVDEPWFDQLDVRIIGKGRLFEETTAPLQGLDNVHLEPRFLQQAEIAAMHREHGVFLCPSRMDSHGVSRDEAMASGLVPITSDAAAIPEFVDTESGFLTPPDDHVAIADAVRALVEDPALFQRMSAAAAARVRRQADHRLVLDAELAALRG